MPRSDHAIAGHGQCEAISLASGLSRCLKMEPVCLMVFFGTCLFDGFFRPHPPLNWPVISGSYWHQPSLGHIFSVFPRHCQTLTRNCWNLQPDRTVFLNLTNFGKPNDTPIPILPGLMLGLSYELWHMLFPNLKHLFTTAIFLSGWVSSSPGGHGKGATISHCEITPCTILHCEITLYNFTWWNYLTISHCEITLQSRTVKLPFLTSVK